MSSTLCLLLALFLMLPLGTAHADMSVSNDDLQSLKSAESTTRDSLQEMRTAIMEYYGDHHDHYPHRLEQLVPTYLTALPPVVIVQHSRSNRVKYIAERFSDDAGGWGYVDNDKSEDFGTVFVNCKHVNADGADWFTE